MTLTKSETVAHGIINLGISLLMGIWLGIPAILSFVDSCLYYNRIMSF